MYEFGSDKDAKRNIEYWANLETDGNMRNEYRTENSRNHQKYVIENDEK